MMSVFFTFLFRLLTRFSSCSSSHARTCWGALAGSSARGGSPDATPRFRRALTSPSPSPCELGAPSSSLVGAARSTIEIELFTPHGANSTKGTPRSFVSSSSRASSFSHFRTLCVRLPDDGQHVRQRRCFVVLPSRRRTSPRLASYQPGGCPRRDRRGGTEKGEASRSPHLEEKNKKTIPCRHSPVFSFLSPPSRHSSLPDPSSRAHGRRPRDDDARAKLRAAP